MAAMKEKIIAYIRENGQATVAELDDILDIKRVMIHRHLKALVEQGVLRKAGSAPKVFYLLNPQVLEREDEKMVPRMSPEWRMIGENFLVVTPAGERVAGIPGFLRWCRKRAYDADKKALEYKKVYKKYEAMRREGLLDGTQKISSTFKNIFIDHVYYIDFYAWEIFGKTKLGQLLLYAKQSEDVRMMKEIATLALPAVRKIIKKHHVAAIGYIPPTVRRRIQLMDVLEKNTREVLPLLSLEKAVTEVRVPQKTLSKIEDRIENARATMFVTDRRIFDTVLLIDDAVGSGATLNEIARKIKDQGVAKKVIGLAITGSAKGFDVISEV